MGNRFYYGMPSTQAFQAMNTLDDDVQAKSTAATAAAQAAASSAAQAGNARDAALAAWQASTAPNEQMAAIGKQFHRGAVVDAFLYDTSRDSDGGAWRKRCKHTSWENEDLASGKWLGQKANISDAWATAGAAAGDYYQNSTYGGFYRLTGSSAAQDEAPTYRGNTREFPALALIVAEAARVVIYDAMQPTLPMWMVFTGDAAGNSVASYNISSVCAFNGMLLVGGQNASQGGVNEISFIKDRSLLRIDATTAYAIHTALSARNVVATVSVTGQPALVNRIVSDISITVLPDAPTDPATGLPTPTIAVATNGGVSIIKHDGTVGNWITNVGYVLSVLIDPRGWLFATGGSTVAYKSWAKYNLPTGIDNTFDAVYNQSSVPARPGTDQNTGQIAVLAQTRSCKALGNGSIHSIPLTLYKENPASPTKAMVAFTSAAYNSGWQVGDSRGAWLADTNVETTNGSAELVTNGMFSTDTSGWYGVNSPTLSVSVSGVSITKPTGTDVSLAQDITTTIGKTYLLKYDVTATSGNYVVGANDSSGNSVGGTGYVSTVGTGQIVMFTATTTRTTVYMQKGGGAGSDSTFDNISVKLADPDRSVKNTGLIVNGSITKAPVATGAQLAGYTGFSAASYLEQPYSANLDFGTGDFSIFAWVYLTGNSVFILERGHNPNVSGDFSLTTDASGNLGAIYQGVATVVSTLKVPLNTWSLVGYVRRSGSGYLSVNGVQQNVNAGVTTNLTSPGAVLRIGLNVPGTAAMIGKLALVRIGATAPSDDQIAQIYRDELALFQPGAQCTIDGTSASVTAMAYDDTTDVLHVGTSWGRSGFRGLQRIESAVSPVGTVATISASRGAFAAAGAGGVRYEQPALMLRDELRRKDVRTTGLHEATPFDFDSTAGMTDFTLPPGWSARDVLVAGVRKRLGATKDYIVSFDGYRDTVRFATSPGAAWVQVMATRSQPG